MLEKLSTRAINLYQQMGFSFGGKLPVYHKLSNGNMVSGNYYYKELIRI